VGPLLLDPIKEIMPISRRNPPMITSAMAKRVPKKEAKKLFINVLLNCSPESDTLRRDFYGFGLTFGWALFVPSSV
jgi:hypothetical protein